MSEMIPLLTSFLSLTKPCYDEWRVHKAKRFQQRTEQVQEHLRKRIQKLEERVMQLQEHEDELNLFMATLNSLFEDDEEAKTGYYAAFLDHLLTETTDRSELRRVAECFQTLSLKELNYLAQANENGKLPKIQEDWLEVSLKSRLISFGMYLDTTVAYGSRLTKVGLLAQKIALKGKSAIAPETKD